jgi:hypothetical protein
MKTITLFAVLALGTALTGSAIACDWNNEATQAPVVVAEGCSTCAVDNPTTSEPFTPAPTAQEPASCSGANCAAPTPAAPKLACDSGCNGQATDDEPVVPFQVAGCGGGNCGP